MSNSRNQSVPHTFQESIAREKVKLEALIATSQPGAESNALRTKIRQLETAFNADDWIQSPGLTRPE